MKAPEAPLSRPGIKNGKERETAWSGTRITGVLECLHLDVAQNARMLPKAELMIANLVIEYTGYSAFQNAIRQAEPLYVSCVIQINTDEGAWVSKSPYIHLFDGLDDIHHQMEEGALTTAMNETGYSRILQNSVNLPNGKALARLDYIKANHDDRPHDVEITYPKGIQEQIIPG